MRDGEVGRDAGCCKGIRQVSKCPDQSGILPLKRKKKGGPSVSTWINTHTAGRWTM
jgi:hypothetical protein